MMKNIKWVGFIKNADDYVIGIIPNTAVKLKEANSMEMVMIHALPFIIPSILILFASMFVKTIISGIVVVNAVGMVAGLILGFFLLIFHEYLHAIVYPKEANISIGVISKLFAAVVLVSYPLSRNRFIIMSLIPVILGVIPLLIFLLLPNTTLLLNSIFFGLAAMGLTSPYPDFYNIYNISKQVPKRAFVQFHKSGTYWFY